MRVAISKKQAKILNTKVAYYKNKKKHLILRLPYHKKTIQYQSSHIIKIDKSIE
jgi:hypothetical protein